MDSLSSLSNFVKDLNKTSTSKDIMSFMNHKIIKIILYFFLVLYAWLVVPTLPKNAIKIFNNPFFKLLVFFVIAYYGSNGDVTISILIAICFVLSLIVLNKNDTEESILDLLNIHKKKMNVKSSKKKNNELLKKNNTTDILGDKEYNVSGNIINDKYNMIEGFDNEGYDNTKGEINEGFDNVTNTFDNVIESFDGAEYALY